MTEIGSGIASKSIIAGAPIGPIVFACGMVNPDFGRDGEGTSRRGIHVPLKRGVRRFRGGRLIRLGLGRVA